MSSAAVSDPAAAIQRSVSGRAAASRADKVLAAFNTWSFKREQPSNVPLIESRVADAIRSDKPLTFVLYWGKGPRDAIAAPDVACLEYLAAMCNRVAGVHAPGAEFCLIFTDTHAALNGHPHAAYERYFAEVGDRAAALGFKGFRLGDIVRAAGPIAIDASHLEEEHVTLLMRSADRWFRGSGTAHEGARRYLAANMVERQAVERAFPAAIFATFNGSEFDFIFPSRLPRFYMYSLRKGCSVKPWFMDAGGRPLASAG